MSPQKKWWGNRCFLPPATFKPNALQRLQSYEAHVDQRNQEAFKAWSFDDPFRPGASAIFFQGWSCCFFFLVVPLNERKLTLEKSTVIVGGNFLCSFFFVRFWWLCIFWVDVPPVQNGTWNFPCGVFLDEANWFARMTMIWRWRYSSIERSMAFLGEACFWVKDILACSTGGATSFHSTGPKSS